MARAKVTKTERERREILAIVRDRALVPERVARFAIRHFGTMADAFPTRKDGEYWCDHCGGRFTAEVVKRKRDADTTKCVCPYCGAKLTMHIGGVERQRGYAYNYARYVVRPRTNRTDGYIKEVTTYKDWQVLKEYFVSKHARIGEKPRFDITPVYSIWLRPTTRSVHIYTLPTIGLGQWYCRTPFALNSSYRFARSSVDSNLYHGWTEGRLFNAVLPYYPDHGCDIADGGEITFAAYTEAGMEIETLTKLGQREMVLEMLQDRRYRRIVVECWRGVVLALRHGYGGKIREVGPRLWLDYLKELRELRLDWHSPHYLCPADFFAAHAETSRRMTKKMKLRAERMAEGRIRAALERDVAERERRERATADFEKRVAKFLPLTILGPGLVIRPLASVGDFRDEGDAMHHCVYSNGYYMRPECLILSARTDEGKRVETVEVNLSRYDIVQSRGVCNQPTDRHDEIIRLVTDAMPQIKALSKTRNYRKSV